MAKHQMMILFVTCSALACGDGFEDMYDLPTPPPGTYIPPAPEPGPVLTTLSGLVSDTAGLPIEAVRINTVVSGEILSAITDPVGKFDIGVPLADLPEHFIIFASKAGFIPVTHNIYNDASGLEPLELTLEELDDNVVVVEIEPQLHHLGNDVYSGAINSQFQLAAEGLEFSTTFTVTAAQANLDYAALTLSAKGLQCDNELSLNGQLVAFLNTAPEDGSFGEVLVELSTEFLLAGENRIDIVSSQGGLIGDFDDFEFSNIVLRFSNDVIGVPVVPEPEPEVCDTVLPIPTYAVNASHPNVCAVHVDVDGNSYDYETEKLVTWRDSPDNWSLTVPDVDTPELGQSFALHIYGVSIEQDRYVIANGLVDGWISLAAPGLPRTPQLGESYYCEIDFSSHSLADSIGGNGSSLGGFTCRVDEADGTCQRFTGRFNCPVGID